MLLSEIFCPEINLTLVIPCATAPPFPSRIVSIIQMWYLISLRSNSSWQRTVSKEQPGYLVTEILNNGILIPLDISKELINKSR